jgi:hypothetical protein
MKFGRDAFFLQLASREVVNRKLGSAIRSASGCNWNVIDHSHRRLRTIELAIAPSTEYFSPELA